MKKNYLISIIFLVLLVTLITSAQTQTPDRISVLIHAYDSITDVPVVNASITMDNNLLGVTDVSGRFLISNIVLCSDHTLVIFQKNYQSIHADLLISSHSEITIPMKVQK